MPLPFRRVLVANRGEIAVRVLRTCRELGVPTAAVYSDADRDAPHVALADIAVPIGTAPAVESYLRADKLLAAAEAAGADAIHPGYGFLSESADFAQACADAGITFVGPSAAAIRRLGDKIAARGLAEQAGVPVVPGYAGESQSARRLRAEASAIGVPLIVKAAAGGGGRGMRVVESLDGLGAAIDEARREAAAVFGDDRLFLERYVERPRHVEVQVFADAHGGVVHLGERECSVQRRHQKIVEESPSPAVTPDLRRSLADAAVALARAAGYTNAGTVEFIIERTPDATLRPYFLEVNARLQVEHPVTEMVTGIDLVALQLHLAAGERMPFTQSDVRPYGHAFEARICVEDPAAGFLPCVGRLERWAEPSGPWVRVDSGVEQGQEIAAHYDPMLAKLIVWGQTRAQALSRLEEALHGFTVLGVGTNIAYLQDVISHPSFRAGDLSTRFLPEHFAGWRPDADPPPDVLMALAGELVTPADSTAPTGVTGDEDAWSPWRSTSSWRSARPANRGSG